VLLASEVVMDGLALLGLVACTLAAPRLPDGRCACEEFFTAWAASRQPAERWAATIMAGTLTLHLGGPIS
jgi:hypothetical protein